jgi:CheY-like chemotaxis protein
MATTFLIVEDNRIHRYLIEKVLKKEFPHVTFLTATTGKQAIDIIDLTPPQLVILDIGLPDISGYEVMKHLRRKTGEVPVVILSAATQHEVSENLEGLNTYYYINKGTDIVAQLPQLVRSAFDIVHGGSINGALDAIEQACMELTYVFANHKNSSHHCTAV